MENNDTTPMEQMNEVIVNQPEVKENEASAQSEGSLFGNFKFFGNCSRSLKRFSVIIFILNVFLAIGILSAVILKIVIELGTAILPLLALPVFTLFVLLIIIARFISALIYGFAEIVEKSEK